MAGFGKRQAGVPLDNDVSSLMGAKASGWMTFLENPSDGDTLTLNGMVFTFLDSPSVATDIQTTEDDLDGTLDNIITALDAIPAEDSYDYVNLLPIVYTKEGEDTLVISAKYRGIVWNSYTMDSDVPHNRSGDTLLGGKDSEAWVNYELRLVIDGSKIISVDSNNLSNNITVSTQATGQYRIIGLTSPGGKSNPFVVTQLTANPICLIDVTNEDRVDITIQDETLTNEDLTGNLYIQITAKK